MPVRARVLGSEETEQKERPARKKGRREGRREARRKSQGSGRGKGQRSTGLCLLLGTPDSWLLSVSEQHSRAELCPSFPFCSCWGPK